MEKQTVSTQPGASLTESDTGNQAYNSPRCVKARGGPGAHSGVPSAGLQTPVSSPNSRLAGARVLTTLSLADPCEVHQLGSGLCHLKRTSAPGPPPCKPLCDHACTPSFKLPPRFVVRRRHCFGKLQGKPFLFPFFGLVVSLGSRATKRQPQRWVALGTEFSPGDGDSPPSAATWKASWNVPPYRFSVLQTFLPKAEVVCHPSAPHGYGLFSSAL